MWGVSESLPKECVKPEPDSLRSTDKINLQNESTTKLNCILRRGCGLARIHKGSVGACLNRPCT